MNFRLPAILFGVVLILGVVLLGITLYDTEEKPPTDILLEELAVVAAKPDQIDTIEFERADGGRLKLVRVGKDKWEVAEPVKAKADSFAATAAVNALFRAKPITHAELRSNPAVHGLDPPSLKVTLRQGTERAATVNIGDVTLGGNKAVAFVTTSARPGRPMAVAKADLDVLFKNAAGGGRAGDLAKWTADYRVKNVFSPEAAAIEAAATGIKITARGKELALTKGKDGWKFDAPAGWGDADTAGDSAPGLTTFTGVRPLLTAIAGLAAAGPDDFIENPKDLKEYGLEPGNPDLIRIELKTKDGPPEVVYLGKKVDAAAPPPIPGMPPMPAGKVYARVEGENSVVRVSANNLDALAGVAADPSAIRDRTLLGLSRAAINAVDITAGGQTTKLRQTEGTWKLVGGPNDPQPVAANVFARLIDGLTERRTIKDFPASNDANFAGPELKAEVKLWTEGFDPPANGPDGKSDPKAEPKPKGNPTTLLFGRKQGDTIFVRRILPDGAKADFVLPEKVGAANPTDLLAAVAKTRLDFLDPMLKGFASSQVNRLTVAQGADVLELEFDDKKDPPSYPNGKWTFVKPEAQKGRVADEGVVSDLLTALATTQLASRIVAENPTDAQLSDFGLDPKAPRMRVTVGLKAQADPADKERVYEFGKDTADPAFVYARQPGRAVVFTLPKVLFERFVKPDLRDRTVIRFDRSKVKSLKLHGWASLAGGVPHTLEFEKQGTSWTVKAPPGFNLDPAKVEQFLGLLDGLRAKAFVPGGHHPDHGFPPQAQGLEVTIELDGGQKITLNIAAPWDNGNSYVVDSQTVPRSENPFTIQSDPFKPFKDKPGSFAK